MKNGCFFYHKKKNINKQSRLTSNAKRLLVKLSFKETKFEINVETACFCSFINKQLVQSYIQSYLTKTLETSIKLELYK